jgi:riboflavin synthase
VVKKGASSFTLSLIPYTLANTALKDKAPGDRVNLEADVLAKYVESLLAR